MWYWANEIVSRLGLQESFILTNRHAAGLLFIFISSSDAGPSASSQDLLYLGAAYCSRFTELRARLAGHRGSYIPIYHNAGALNEAQSELMISRADLGRGKNPDDRRGLHRSPLVLVAHASP